MSRRSRKHFRGANRNRRLCMEALEPRLALTWAGVPPVSIAPPTSSFAVTLSSQSDATGTALISTTEIDYYSFTARTGGSYVVSAATPSSSLDTVIGLFSSSGQRLGYNDDYGGSSDSRLAINLTAGTRYYLAVTNYSTTSRGSYTWTIDGPAAPTVPDDAYENNDSLSAAYNLGTLTSTRTLSQLKLIDADDWYRFTTSGAGTSGSSVSIGFQNSQGNLQLALYNSAGTLLASSQGTGNSETISLNGRAAGTYHVRIFGNAGATNANYTLSINPPAASTPPPPVSGGFQITLSMNGLTTSQRAIFDQAADRWEQIIVGDLPNATYRGQAVDDLLINASSVSIDGVNGVLGQAGPTALRAGSRLPYVGVMEFDTADMANMERNGSLLSVVMHEMGHVLGIGTIWSSLGLLSGARTSNPIFVGTQATAAYNQIFGTSASGVPVENTGGSGTRDSHWRDSIFRNEVMTGWIGPGTNLPVSRVTVASLADIGYTVNYAAASAYTPSSSAIALAVQASGSSSDSARLVGLSESPNNTREVAISYSTSQNPSPHRQSALERPAVRFNTETVDAVMAAARRTEIVPTNDDLRRECETEDATIAWVAIESILEHWPTLALT